MGAVGQPGNDEELALFNVGPFGGLDTATSAYYVSPNNFADMLNFVPNDIYGTYTTALGRVTRGSLPSEPNGIFKFSRKNLPDVYLFAVDVSGAGAIYQGPLGGPYLPLALPYPLTAGQQTYFETSLEWVFVTNGVDNPIKIDTNLAVTRWGIVAPTVKPTVAPSGVSTMEGTYTYCYTFGNSKQESSQGFPLSDQIFISGTGVLVSGIQTSTDPQVTQRNVYRVGGGLGTWQLVRTLNDNVTTSFVDTLGDDQVDGQFLVIRRDPPQPFKYITTHKERIFGWGTPTDDSIVYFSNLNEPWGFNNTSGNRPVGENSFSDGAAGMTSNGSVLVLNKRETLYYLYGNDDTDFLPVKISDTGCLSGNSVATLDSMTCWIDRRGIWMTQGQAPEIISDGGFQSSNIKNYLKTLTVDDLQKSVGFWYDRMYHISFPTKNKTYFFDLRSKAWYALGWACRQVFQDPQSDFPIITDNQQALGQVLQWFAAPTDLGQPVMAYILSRISDSDDSSSEKIYRKVEVLAPPQNALCFVTLIANPGNQQYSEVLQVDLNIGTTRHQVAVPRTIRGAEIQVEMRTFSSTQLTIQKLTVYGQIDRRLIEQSNGGALQ